MPRFRALISLQIIQFILLLVGIFCVSLLAIQPFTLNQMPETADGILHLFRIAAVDHSLKVDNPLWVRYSTGIAYGYGAPLFNYFPPLSYYLGSWLHTIGLTFVQSWLAITIIYTMLAGLGMFFLGRIWTQSNVGGWVSAIAYIYAPYLLFDSVSRGTISELAALAILPFAMYGFTRLSFYGRRLDFVFTVFIFALFIPLHTLMTLHGTALLAVYCLFLWLTSEDKTSVFLRLLLAGVLGFLVTSFFWMPAILETNATKINLITENLDQIDVTRHLRPITEILTLPHTADPTQMNQNIPITLGWVQIILAGFGLIIAWNDRNLLYRNLLVFLGVIVAVLVFLNTPTSVWIWENVPLMDYTQFPWRVLGLASLALSLMTGISVWLAWTIVPEGWRKLAVFSALTLVVVVYSIPWTYSSYLGDIELSDIRDVHDFERATGQLTVSSYSEYLPISTDESQLDPNRLIDRFEQGDVIPRLVETDAFTILDETWTSTSGNLKIQSDEPQTLIFDWLWIDGWTVIIDGATIDTYPAQPDGRVGVDVPSGEFDMYISLQPTTIQSISVGLSLLGAGIVVLVVFFWKPLSGFSNLHQLELDPEISIFGIVVMIGVGVFLFKAVILDYTNTSFKSVRYDGLVSENVEITPLANFGNQIDLLDVEIVYEDFRDQILPIKLYWKLHDSSIETDYSAVIRMRNPEDIVIAEQNLFQIGDIDTSNWLLGNYVKSDIEFEIPKYTPADLYSIEISLFDPQTLTALDIINQQNNPEGVEFSLAAFPMTGDWFMRRYDYIEPLEADQTMSNVIGIYLPKPPEFPQMANAGDEIIFNWTWQKRLYSIDDQNHFAKIQWVDVNSQVVFESSAMTLTAYYETQLWRVGDVFTAYYRLLIPADIPAGVYNLQIQLLAEDKTELGEPHVLNSEITIVEPERILDAPEYEYDVGVFWQNRIQLIGYNLTQDNDLTLIWNTGDILDTNLRLFVHVLNESDLIVAQTDGIPVNWTRPTTSWIPAEYVTTRHKFDAPDGEYRIRIGWYDPITGDRVGVQLDDSYILEQTLKID